MWVDHLDIVSRASKRRKLSKGREGKEKMVSSDVPSLASLFHLLSLSLPLPPLRGSINC